jgi:2-C-methyl-D-erythritol 4-phosphate cytidylyltransferase
MPEVGVVIAGGGKGVRLGGSTPKQFLLLDSIPILLRTARRFEQHPAVSQIVVVVPSAYLLRAERLLRRGGCRKIARVVAGGADRQESVRRGMRAFPVPPGVILVHDAVRPFVSKRVIAEVIKGAVRYGGAVVGVRVTDTIKTGHTGGYYGKTLDRSNLWAVQTPQGFRRSVLERAHERAARTGFVGTDEASLVERIGLRVRIVEGDYGNIKITTREDLKLAKMKLKPGG